VSAGRIPVENVYFLLSYAWDRLEERELTHVSLTPEARLPELFARVLLGGVTHLLKRGLDRSYLLVEGEIAGVRGRLDVAASLKRATFPRARAWCAFDELSPDVPHNRIVKTTLRRLASVAELDVGIAEGLRELYRRMPEVRETTLTDASFRRVTLHRNASYYRFLLDVCEIVHRNLLVDERSGETMFRDFTRDDAQMAQLFERFLFRFYEREQRTYHVEAPHLRWNAEGSPAGLDLLPRMRTDVVLRSPSETIVLDAKYYASTLSEHFGKESVHSEHLYQLTTYMRHLEADGAGLVRGVLVYPRTTRAIRADVRLFGRPVRIATVDLARPWPEIARDLRELVDLDSAGRAADVSAYAEI
jgi:5-methylcytosine-specific restriction enzyme subunit McrC